MTIEGACSAGRKDIEKEMSYEVIVMRFIQTKLIKSTALLTMKKRVIMADGIHTLAYGHTNLKNCNLKNELQWYTKYFSW